MKIINFKFCFSIVLLFCLCSCFFNYEVYNFSKPQKEFKWGNVGVSSLGTEKLFGCTGTIERPYELGLLFWSKKFLSGTIHIEEIKVQSQKTKQCFLLQKNLTKSITKKIDICSALFQFPNLNLPFENLEVHVNFDFITEDSSSRYDITLLMKPEYTKHPIMFGT